MAEDDAFAARPMTLPVVVGEDLSRLSVDELSARIDLLQGEIERTESERAARGGVLAAADALFRK
jgi:uncharacterized small protein (DUF1192 family)